MMEPNRIWINDKWEAYLRPTFDGDTSGYIRADLATPAAMTPEVRALVEAAEPLAAMASRYDPENGDGDLECWSGLAVPKIKHIRALRSALAALREGGGA